MSSHRATSTCWRSNSKSGSRATDSIIPPTPLVETTADTSPLVCASVVSRARARMHNSSSSAPGIAWMTQRESRRRSRPFGEDPGIAAKRRPPARIGQNGCTRGLPSLRTVARYAMEKHGVSDATFSPRCNAVMPGQSRAATAATAGAAASKSAHVDTDPQIASGQSYDANL